MLWLQMMPNLLQSRLGINIQSNQIYFEKHTITKSIQKDHLTAIHVMKRSIDLQLWIMVSGGWY